MQDHCFTSVLLVSECPWSTVGGRASWQNIAIGQDVCKFVPTKAAVQHDVESLLSPPWPSFFRFFLSSDIKTLRLPPWRVLSLEDTYQHTYQQGNATERDAGENSAWVPALGFAYLFTYVLSVGVHPVNWFLIVEDAPWLPLWKRWRQDYVYNKHRFIYKERRLMALTIQNCAYLWKTSLSIGIISNSHAVELIVFLVRAKGSKTFTIGSKRTYLDSILL